MQDIRLATDLNFREIFQTKIVTEKKGYNYFFPSISKMLIAFNLGLDELATSICAKNSNKIASYLLLCD